jgi:uncharacterized protein (DUF983 family)
VTKDRTLLHGPLPSCPVCGTKLEYLKVVRFGTPFNCINCQTELRVAKSDTVIDLCVTIAISVFAAFMIGLRGRSLLLVAVLLMVPFFLLTTFVRRHSSPPKLELSSSTLKLSD